MAIQSIFNSAPATELLKVENQVKPTPYEAQQSFGTFLKDAIQQVNTKQHESDMLTQKLVLGGYV